MPPTISAPEKSGNQISTTSATNLALLAFEELAELQTLAKNLSFLSYNAGFAGFRAGEDGRTVSVLTQFTRRASEELQQAHAEIQGLRSKTYRKNAELLVLQRKDYSLCACLELLALQSRQESQQEEPEGDGSERGELLPYSEACRLALDRFRGEMERGFLAVFRYLESLWDCVQDLEDVLMRMENIATRVAIEATGIRDNETDFVQVAERMRGDCEVLRKMLFRTKRAIRTAQNESCSRMTG
jgi:hypothetical protein